MQELDLEELGGEKEHLRKLVEEGEKPEQEWNKMKKMYQKLEEE